MPSPLSERLSVSAAVAGFAVVLHPAPHTRKMKSGETEEVQFWVTCFLRLQLSRNLLLVPPSLPTPRDAPVQSLQYHAIQRGSLNI